MNLFRKLARYQELKAIELIGFHIIDDPLDGLVYKKNEDV
jgi:hypothetical protein